MDTEAKTGRGKKFFTKVYAQHTPGILNNLSRAHPDLAIYAIETIYGELLSEFTILNEQSTSLVEMVACIASNSIPQAKGHVYGAINMGESPELLQQCVQLVATIAKEEGARVEFGKMEFLRKIGIQVPTENGVQI
jgi:alkylhydroperoxidase/carboxymuconolactone decarboxylase family protein YurZ